MMDEESDESLAARGYYNTNYHPKHHNNRQPSYYKPKYSKHPKYHRKKNQQPRPEKKYRGRKHAEKSMTHFLIRRIQEDAQEPLPLSQAESTKEGVPLQEEEPILPFQAPSAKEYVLLLYSI
jgi:hypothetical protein